MTQFTDALRGFIPTRNFIGFRNEILTLDPAYQREEILHPDGKRLFQEALDSNDTRRIAAFFIFDQEVVSDLARSAIGPNELRQRELYGRSPRISALGQAQAWQDKAVSFCDNEQKEFRQEICDSIPDSLQWEFFNVIEDKLAKRDAEDGVEYDVLDSPDLHKFKFVLSYGSITAVREEFNENEFGGDLTHKILNDLGREGFINAVLANRLEVVQLVLKNTDQQDRKDTIDLLFSEFGEADIFIAQDEQLTNMLTVILQSLDKDQLSDLFATQNFRNALQNMAVVNQLGVNQLGSVEFVLDQIDDVDVLEEIINEIDENISNTLEEDDSFLIAWQELKDRILQDLEQDENSQQESEIDDSEIEDFKQEEGTLGVRARSESPDTSLNPTTGRRLNQDNHQEPESDEEHSR